MCWTLRLVSKLHAKGVKRKETEKKEVRDAVAGLMVWQRNAVLRDSCGCHVHSLIKQNSKMNFHCISTYIAPLLFVCENFKCLRLNDNDDHYYYG